MVRYAKIIGGTEEEAEKKFPWLKDAVFKNARIDITNSHLVWRGGVWNDGVWKGGFWYDGFWYDGVWCGGFWCGGVWNDGVWNDGLMWSNVKQKYVKVKQSGKSFKEED